MNVPLSGGSLLFRFWSKRAAARAPIRRVSATQSQEIAMSTDDMEKRNRNQTGHKPAPGAHVERPPEQQNTNAEARENRGSDANKGGDAIRAGAPGKPIDNVGGPGLGVPPGGKDRSGNSGASGASED
jgi:hypothetical protein